MMMEQPVAPLPPAVAGDGGGGGGHKQQPPFNEAASHGGAGEGTAAALRLLEAVIQLAQDPRRAADPAALALLVAQATEPGPSEADQALAELRAREQLWRGALRAARAEARQAAEARAAAERELADVRTKVAELAKAHKDVAAKNAQAFAAAEAVELETSRQRDAAEQAREEAERALASLRAEVATLQSGQAALQATVETERAECARLKALLSEARAAGDGKVSGLAAELESVTASYQELQEKLERAQRAAHDEGQRAEERARQLRRQGDEEAAALRAQLEAARAEAAAAGVAAAAVVAGKEEALAAVRAELDAAKAEAAAARREGEERVLEVSGQGEALGRELAKARAALRASEEETQQLRAQLEAAGAEAASEAEASRGQLAAAQAQVGEAEAGNARLQEAAAAAEAEAASLRAENETLRAAAGGAAAEEESRSAELAREVEALRAQLAAAQQEAARGADAATTERDGLAQALQAAEARAASLEGNKAAGEAALAQAKQELETAQARLGELEEEVEGLRRSAAADGEGLRAELAALGTSLAESEAVASAGEEALVAAHSVIEEKEVVLAELAARLEAAEAAAGEKDAEVAQLRERLTAAEASTAAAEAAATGVKEALEGQLGEAQAATAAALSEAEGLRARVAAAEEASAALNQQLAAAEAQAAELEEAKAQAAAAAEEAQEAVARGEEEQARLQAELKGLQGHVAALEQEAEAAKEVEGLKAQLAAEQEQTAALKARVAALEAEAIEAAVAAQQRVAELEAQATAAKAACKAEAAAAQARIADLERRVQMVEDARDAVANGAAEAQQKLRREKEVAVVALEGEVARLTAEVEALRDAAAAGRAVEALNPSPSLPLSLLSAQQRPPTRLFLIETGAWKLRAGFVHLEPTSLSPALIEATTSPSVVARPKQPNADYALLVKNAGVQADPMYARFRASGVFVGKNAWYCAFEHPDAALRGKLKLESPMCRDRLPRPEDLTWLWRDVLERMEVDPHTTPILLLYKPTYPPADQAAFVRAAFDACEQHALEAPSPASPSASQGGGGWKVRFLAEPLALASAAGARTALVVDVGEECTRVVPIYENMVLAASIQTAPVGGRDLTAYLASMLESCTTDPYSGQSLRRRLDIARMVKERHAYVAGDFEAEVAQCGGGFEREVIDVMTFQRDKLLVQDDTAPGKRVHVVGADSSSSKGEDAAAVLVSCTARLPDGSDLRFRVGKERFHCPELLFRPGLFSEGGQEEGAADSAARASSLPDLILRALAAFEDEADKAQVLAHLCLAGHTTQLPGFTERLTAELKARLPPSLAARLRVHPLERGAVDAADGAAAAIPERRTVIQDEDDLLPSPSAAFSAAPAPAFDSAVAQAAAGAADRALAAAGAWWDSAEWGDGRDVAELVADVNFADGL